MLFEKVVMCTGSVRTIISEKGMGFKAGDFLKINFDCPWNEGFIVLGFEGKRIDHKTMCGFSLTNEKVYRLSSKNIRNGTSNINHHFHISKPRTWRLFSFKKSIGYQKRKGEFYQKHKKNNDQKDKQKKYSRRYDVV